MAYRHTGTKITVTDTAQSLSALLAAAGITMPPSGPGLCYATLLIKSDSGNTAASKVFFGANTGVSADGTPTTNLTSAGVGATGYVGPGEGAGWDLHGGGMAYTSNFFLCGSVASSTVYVDIHE